MTIEILLENLLNRKNELSANLEKLKIQSNEIEEKVRNSEISIQELTNKLDELDHKIKDNKDKYKLTNNTKERGELRRRLTGLEVDLRKTKSEKAMIRSKIPPLEEELLKIHQTLDDTNEKTLSIERIITDLENAKIQEFIDVLINLPIEYSNLHDVMNIYFKLLDFSLYRIKQVEVERIEMFIAEPSGNSTLIQERVKRYEDYLDNPNINENFLEILMLWLNNLYNITAPSIQQGLKEIRRRKELNPDWINDYQKVLDMYNQLRGGRRIIQEELEDLELILDTLLEEAREYGRDNKFMWVHIKCDEMEDIVNRYIGRYPSLRKYRSAIEWHRNHTI